MLRIGIDAPPAPTRSSRPALPPVAELVPLLTAGGGQGFCVNLSVDTSSVDLMTTPTVAKLAEKLARTIHEDVASKKEKALDRLRIGGQITLREIKGGYVDVTTASGDVNLQDVSGPMIEVQPLLNPGSTRLISSCALGAIGSSAWKSIPERLMFSVVPSRHPLSPTSRYFSGR